MTEGTSRMPECAFCNIKSDYFPKCRICQRPVCIHHYRVVRDVSVPGGLAAECDGCFKKDAKSLWEFAVGP